jgi:hypothetical protein
MKLDARCPRACEGTLREVSKEGVLIDLCTKCGGVWLDKGELEKILALSRQDIADYDAYVAASQPGSVPAAQPAAYAPPPPPQQGYAPYPPPPPPHYRDNDDDDYKRRHHGHGHHYPYKRKSRLETLFDVFD